MEVDEQAVPEADADEEEQEEAPAAAEPIPEQPASAEPTDKSVAQPIVEEPADEPVPAEAKPEPPVESEPPLPSPLEPTPDLEIPAQTAVLEEVQYTNEVEQLPPGEFKSVDSAPNLARPAKPMLAQAGSPLTFFFYSCCTSFVVGLCSRTIGQASSPLFSRPSCGDDCSISVGLICGGC